MNIEKIREIAEKAGWGGGEFSLDGFAEGLIRECAKVAKGCAEGSLAVSLAIKHHFDIREISKEKSDE